MLNVTLDGVKQGKRIMERGAPELAEAVRREEISLAAAVDLTELPKERQAEVLAEGPAAVKNKVREFIACSDLPKTFLDTGIDAWNAEEPDWIAMRFPALPEDSGAG